LQHLAIATQSRRPESRFFKRFWTPAPGLDISGAGHRRGDGLIEFCKRLRYQACGKAKGKRQKAKGKADGQPVSGMTGLSLLSLLLTFAFLLFTFALPQTALRHAGYLPTFITSAAPVSPAAHPAQRKYPPPSLTVSSIPSMMSLPAVGACGCPKIREHP